MTLVRHSSGQQPRAPSFASDTAPDQLMQQAQQCLDHAARSRTVDRRQILVAREAIARSRALLAQGSAGQDHEAEATRPLVDEPHRAPLSPPSQETAAAPGDLAKEIAATIVRLVAELMEEHGLVFQLADPEPVLRGVASAYAAIAQALPGGREEAWTFLGLLALELDAAGPHQDPDERRSRVLR